ncbi:cobalt transporter ATP-binding subunit [Staphylococcus petrasii]|uniref:Energy-coupling factor transporter ATP-binding protein EcfA2 n=1 Tax=Staphylococcus petrasii TaxID=1276936 RepID=A0A380FZP3_9STAP|nr:energy-coupling factor transporter ATPase [Staphylococcus petrasii]PNZ30669.1 energy-coupling factor transporter ATPase [Staphylococcus petrasii]TGE11956.1 energy-coupling factor transporter ATPase [Staphylococcus petrasii]TGE19047.1 energy-coupling factor transporter ATPase [Staphylococcus petrasii]SUM43271.1 cobalt transporter ATP-binding subunit [Staphylococcus petrasii]
MTITFNDVTYTYQIGTPYEYQALKNINLTLEQGKYYAIVGQTGSGKSTLIQHFNGLLKPTSGSVEFNDLTITHKTKDKHIRPLRQKVGLVFQFPESQLFEDNVEREIEFGPRNFKMDIEEVKARAYNLLVELGFSRDVMALSPFQMSGGQMRKIAIVSILAMNPDVIILDEPTAGLDPKSRHQVMELFKKIQLEQNKTIILVSHDMNDVAKYADEIIVMKEGSIAEQISPKKLFKQETQLNEWHIALPDIVRLQKDFEQKYHTELSDVALTAEEFVKLYQEWQQHEE